MLVEEVNKVTLKVLCKSDIPELYELPSHPASWAPQCPGMKEKGERREGRRKRKKMCPIIQESEAHKTGFNPILI